LVFIKGQKVKEGRTKCEPHERYVQGMDTSKQIQVRFHTYDGANCFVFHYAVPAKRERDALRQHTKRGIMAQSPWPMGSIGSLSPLFPISRYTHNWTHGLDHNKLMPDGHGFTYRGSKSRRQTNTHTHTSTHKRTYIALLRLFNAQSSAETAGCLKHSATEHIDSDINIAVLVTAQLI
jgi:hypothetical protein